ncbi:MAG: FAD-dependent oxidoreductase [Patescibacteria group bacterium]
MSVSNFDLLIVGGGAAGLSCAIYAVRYNLRTVVISSDFGGQILETSDIENWPGIKSITGSMLSKNFEDHARSLGASLVYGFVKAVKREEKNFRVETDANGFEEVFVKSVVLTSGAKHKKLGIRGEKELSGRGISYCATCDGAFFKNKVVAVVGGGDSAITGALDLASNAAKVYVIHRRDVFKAKPSYVDAARAHPKIDFIMETNLVEVGGSNKLEYVILDKDYKDSNRLLLDGVFVEVGFLPETELVRNLGVEFDDQGYLKVAKDQSTNIPGLFAAGDVTNASNRFAQLVTAASEGAIAAEASFRYIAFK